MFAGQIAYCAQKGIISGYGDGTFRPAGTLTGYAFTKMLLGALGYDSDIEGFTGPNWTINVAKLVSNLGLDDGNDEFSGTAAVTREEASLYAFNALQADVVEYGDKTSININGMEVNIGSKEAKAMTFKNSDTNDGGIKDDDIIQFAEQNFPKLKKLADTDAFARPATKWTFKGDKIGSYVDTPDVSYTTNVKLGQIYTDLNMTQKDKNAEVWVNGVKAYDVAVSKNNSIKIASNDATEGANNGLVDDGSIVDVYYFEDDNDVRICVVDVYVGTVSNVVTKNTAEPYIVVEPYSDIYTKGATKIAAPDPYGGLAAAEKKYETEESFSEDDVVLFTFSQQDGAGSGAIKDVWAPESVEGTVSKIVFQKSLELDSTTTYKYSKNAAFLEQGKANDTAVNTKGDYTVYLDDNGLVIYVSETEFNPDDYAFVLYAETSSTKFGKDRAQLVTSAGKVITVNTDDDYTDLAGQVVLFRENSDGEYALRSPAANRHGEMGTIHSADPGYAAPAGNVPVNGADTGVATGGATNFSMKNDNAKITYTDGSGNAVSLRANSETVFVTAETTVKSPGVYETTYNAYVGIKNAPSIASNGATDPDFSGITPQNGCKVEAFWATRSNSLLAFMFIDVTEANHVSGKKDVVFFAGLEGVSKLTENSDGKQYYTYNAVVDGEITTVNVLASNCSAPAGFVSGEDVNGVYTNIRYDNRGFVNGISAVGTDYDILSDAALDVTGGSAREIVGTGVWKLSGKYTVGLGTGKQRETVSDSAKIFYVDQDGVITKKDSMSEVYSDSNATFIALRDANNGDIEYLFIQEPSNNKEEGSTGGGAATGITVKKVAGGVNFKWVGAAPSTAYTATLSYNLGGSDNVVGNWSHTTAAAETTIQHTFPTGDLIEGAVYTVKVSDNSGNVVISGQFKA